jgi:hypothetical protein
MVELSRIKEIIGRISRCNGGFPRQFIRYIVQDLVDMNLIIRLSNEQYRILKSPLEQRIKALMMAC